MKNKTNENPGDWHDVWELTCMTLGYLAIVAVIVSTLALYSRPVHANEINQLDEVRQGSLLFNSDNGRYRPAPTLHTDIEINISGMIARTKVRQQSKT